MSKSGNKAFWVIGGILAFFGIKALATNAATQLGNNIVAGEPKARNLFLEISGTQFPIKKVSDFFSLDIVNFLVDNIFSLSFPKFIFDLAIPITNSNAFPIPTNSFSGKIIFQDKEVGTAQYLPIDLPAGATKEMLAPVTMSLNDIHDIGNVLLQNPGSILSGVTVTGNFVFNAVPVNIPYTKNIKFF